MTLSRSSSKKSNSRCSDEAYFTDDSADGDVQQTLLMESEVSAAVGFLCDMMGKISMDASKIEAFRECLKTVMLDQYRNHWYPKMPLRGSAYRCVRINGTLDPLVVKAASMASLCTDLVRSAFPVELSLWVDPGEVSIRFGEEGSIGVIHSCDPLIAVAAVGDDEEDEEQSDSQESHDSSADAMQLQRYANNGQQQQVGAFNGAGGQQYRAVDRMLLAGAEAPPRYFNSDVRSVGGVMQRDCTWTHGWSQPGFGAKGSHRHHATQFVARDYGNIQMQHLLVTPNSSSSCSYPMGRNAGASPTHCQPTSVGQSEPNGGNNQLSRHCRALAEQLILNSGGVLWSSNNCGDGSQVMETVVN